MFISLSLFVLARGQPTTGWLAGRKEAGWYIGVGGESRGDLVDALDILALVCKSGASVRMSVRPRTVRLIRECRECAEAS